MKRMPYILSAVLAISAITGLAILRRAPENPSQAKEAIIMFYNVENLFDTEDDPDKNDESFTPESEKAWTADRYSVKLDRIAEVISGIGGERWPAIAGLAEVENERVLQDLISNEQLKKGKYAFVHFEGPDERGIDVALLYARDQFKISHQQSFHVPLPPEERPTRDILYVCGRLKKGPVLHLFVNHWPSRYGGQEESEFKRLAAARVLKSKLDSLKRVDQNAFVVCMGDFNDYPKNKSLSEILEAGPEGDCVNLMYELKEEKRGSYNYRGDWGFLDQFIVSGNLRDGRLPDIPASVTGPYSVPEMLFTDPKYGDIKPSKTYGGPNYYGGYSDHLPVVTAIRY